MRAIEISIKVIKRTERQRRYIADLEKGSELSIWQMENMNNG